jgi:hypothetical protein
VKVTPPAVALANREEEERLREMRNKAGVLSITTWQQQVGLDPKHEAANFEAEARRKGEKEGGEDTEPGDKSSSDEGAVAESGPKKGRLVTAQRRLPDGEKEVHQVKPTTVGTDGWKEVDPGASGGGKTSLGKGLANASTATGSLPKKNLLAKLGTIPGKRLIKLLQQAKSGNQAILQAKKIAQLERKLQASNRGSARFAQLKKKISAKRQALRKLFDEPDFVGTLRGVKQTLHGVKSKPITYKKIDPNVAKRMRSEFDSTARRDFLKKIVSENETALKKAGLSDQDIECLKKGKLPEGGVYQVHHKIPIDAGGTNDPSNLILLRNEPYHKTITNYQNNLIRGMKLGESRNFDYPIPEGFVYPP